MASRSAPHRLLRDLAVSYRRLVGGRASVLLAVSGGADSMALLRGSHALASELGLRLEVATLDHGAREESAGEVRTVAARCAVLGLPCHVRALGLAPGPAFEARAREARRAALEVLRQERGLDLIATAHTANDQAETVLMRLARGTSLRGAAAIHARAGAWIRPLLSTSREDVLAYLAELGEGYVTDPMNADPAFFRARVRHQALPALIAAAGAQTVSRLSDFARAAARDEAFLAEEAGRAAVRLRLPDGSLDRVGLCALPEPLRARVLVAELERFDLHPEAALIDRVDSAARAGRHTAITRTISLRCEGGRLRLLAHRPAVPERAALLAPDGPAEARLLGWRLALSRKVPPAGLTVGLPASLAFPLTVRARQPGDRVRGARGWVKLQDLLTDRRIPAEQRDALPLLVDAAGTIRWVVGVWPMTSRSRAATWFVFAQRASNGGERGEGR